MRKICLIRTENTCSYECTCVPLNEESTFYALLTVHFGIILVNNKLDAHFFSVYVYFDTLHVSSSHVLIIKRLNCINTTSGICHSETK